MKRMILALVLVVGVGVTFYPLQASAQMGYGMMGPGYGYGMGPGMMGPGYGYGPQGGYQGPNTGPGYGGYGMGPGMMGPGYGGYGMGPGMMGRGYGYGMGPGMMGPGYGMGPGMMHGWGYGPYGQQYGPQQYGPQSQQPQKPLDKDQAREILENYLRATRNPNLKLGEMKDEESYFEGEIVTKKEGSLVDKLAVDKDTGWIHPLY